jgi:glutathione S-transferase
MKLYSTWSLNPQKVLFAVKELGLAVDVVEVDVFRGEQRTEPFTKMNPMQKLPVLDDDGFALWESNAILAYLGEREGRLWPSEGRSRADALRWMFFEARHLADSVGALWFFESVAPKMGIPVDGEAVARGYEELDRPMKALGTRLAAAEWILGSSFSLVDCCLGADLVGLAASKFDWAPHPVVKAYVDRIRSRSGWKATDPKY